MSNAVFSIHQKLNFLLCCLFLAPYVKVYVMEGKRCLAKKKTRTARRTLEPLYQQQLEFKVEFTGKTLQVNDLITFVHRVLILCKDGLVIRAPLYSGHSHGARAFPTISDTEMSQICKVLHFWTKLFLKAVCFCKVFLQITCTLRWELLLY